jgi:hypothetical protein
MTQPNQASVRVRQSVLNLTAVEMGHYVQAVQQLKATDAPGKDPSIPAAAVTSKIKIYDWYVSWATPGILEALKPGRMQGHGGTAEVS